jgi:WD repeat-containing protein 42A
MMQIDKSFVVRQKPKARGWMYQIDSPEDLMLQLFSLPRRRVRTETNAERSTATADRELLELILTFNTISDDSTDDDGDDGGNATNQDDLFS